MTHPLKGKRKAVTCCLLVEGLNTAHQAVYAFLAIRLNDLEAVLHALQEGGFNPKAFNAVVLAKGMGPVPPEVEAYMRFKFHFQRTYVPLRYALPRK